MHQTIDRPAAVRIPPLIRRNITLFVLSQSFTGPGMSFAYGIGPLMVVALTHSASLAGLSVSLIGLSRFLVAYPVGKITDSYGRRPGILLGLALALVGAIVLALTMWAHSVALLIGGMLVFGMGMNAAQQLRVAATDMFPPHRRAQALGYVALGSLAGIVVSPVVIATTERIAESAGVDRLALPWLVLPVLILGGMALITFVHPDPKEIGMNLDRYYPGLTATPRSVRENATDFSAMSLLRNGPTRLAIMANSAGQGNMSIVMVLTSLVLAHHGHSLTAIVVSHAFHTAGMFAFTIPLGRLADRVGRGRVMFPGVATTLVGAVLVSFTGAYWSVTLGTFLVGLGWAAANVAATAFLADQVATTERGRAIGVNDSFAGAVAVLAAVGTGPLIDWSGLPAAGLAAVAIAAVPLVMVAMTSAKKE